MITRTRILAIAAVALSWLLAPAWVAPSSAQPGRGAGARGGARAQSLPPAEVERLFDGYVAMQAQEAVQLNDAQFPSFLQRLKGLQQARRRQVQERRLILADLGRALRASPVDEVQLRDGLRRLRESNARNAEEVRKAYDAIDEGLDAAQQARFRLFEESVERRKFDLVLRARRLAQQRRQPGR